MGVLTATASWDDVYKIEDGDIVGPATEGDDSGVSNDPHQNLLNRTEWLYDNLTSHVVNKYHPLKLTAALPSPRSRQGLQVYPEILTDDFKLGLTEGTLSVVVDAGQSFVWRGVFEVSTSDYSEEGRTFSLSSEAATYHLRWNPDDGFVLNSLADTESYNPDSLAASDSNFDTDYNDMLIAKIVVGTSQISSIVRYSNRARLFLAGTYDEIIDTSNSWEAFTSLTLEWARTPFIVTGMSAIGDTTQEFGDTSAHSSHVIAYIGCRASPDSTRDSIYFQSTYRDNSANNGRILMSYSLFA